MKPVYTGGASLNLRQLQAHYDSRLICQAQIPQIKHTEREVLSHTLRSSHDNVKGGKMKADIKIYCGQYHIEWIPTLML